MILSYLDQNLRYFNGLILKFYVIFLFDLHQKDKYDLTILNNIKFIISSIYYVLKIEFKKQISLIG